MNYTQIIPANDWYYLIHRLQDKKPPIVFPVAVWALNAQGAVVGLIGDIQQGTPGMPCESIRLIEPDSNVPGMYKHRSTMSEEEVVAISKHTS